MFDRDLKGNIIQSRAKESKSTEIDGDKRFCGHRFVLRTKLYGDKRCLYCGKWFHWSQENSAEWLRNRNIDNLNADTIIEPLHCGSAHCDDYHHKCLVAQERRKEEERARLERAGMKLFKKLKLQGVI